MIDFLKANSCNLLMLIVFIIGCAVLIKNGYRVKVKQVLFFLVCKAEKIYGSGTGTMKYEAVTMWLYEQLPGLLKLIFSQKEIDKMIETAVEEMKKYLQNSNENTEVMQK